MLRALTKSAQVRLRGITEADAMAITSLLQNDAELALQTASLPIPYTIEDARAFLSTADPQQVFAIVLEDELVGVIGMAGADEPVEIGYWIGRRHWGRGYATFAVSLLVQEARRRGISLLCAEMFPENDGSMRVLEKNGFLRQGEIDRHLPQRGGLRRLIRFRVQT